jgi:type I restriction enzyme, S subunit
VTEQELPRGWSAATITELIAPDGEFCDGDWVESKDQDPAGDVRLIQLADVGDSEYTSKSARFLTSAKARELRCTFLQPGDVLVARMPDPLGRACIFPGDPKPAITVVDVCIVRPGSIGVDSRWLMWTINSPQFRADVAALQSGSTRKRISRGNLATINLPVPPLPEQRRVVAALEEHLSDLDAAVAGLKRARTNVQRYRASVLDAAACGVLIEQAEHLDYREVPIFGRLCRLPRSWTRAAVADLAELVTDGDHNPPKRVATGIPHLTAKNVRTGRLSLEGCSYLTEEGYDQTRSRYEPAPGDLIVTCVGTVGSTALVPQDLRFSADRNLAAVRVRSERVQARWLQIVLDSPRWQQHMKVASGSTAQPHLYLRDLRSLPVPLPELQTQLEIIAEVDRRTAVADHTVSEIDVQIARAARLRQAILRRAFEGKLVPQDPRDEPASVLLARIGADRGARTPAPRARDGTRRRRSSTN